MRTVETSELKRMLERGDNLLLLNVLDPQSFEREHIPGSRNVPNRDLAFLSRVEKLAGGKDRRVVVYCANPSCHASHDAGHKLEGAGFSDVWHYPGGIEGWRSAGYDLEQGAPTPVS